MKLKDMLPSLNQEAAKDDIIEIRVVSESDVTLVTFPVSTGSDDKQSDMLQAGVGSEYMEKEVLSTSFSTDEDPKSLIVVVDISESETPLTADQIADTIQTGEVAELDLTVDEFTAACIRRRIREAIHKEDVQKLL